MRRAGLREFKAKLSAYIREVRRGGSVLLTDRGEVVARVVPAKREKRQGAAYAEAIERGDVRPASDRRVWPFKGWKGAGLRRGESQRILDELRGERSR